MVGRPNGVASDFFKFGQSFPPDFRWDRNSETACILMDTQSFYLYHFSVNVHSLVGNHLDFFKTDPQSIRIDDSIPFKERELQLIQLGLLRTPQLDIGNLHSDRSVVGFA
ncbi:hypothetical protein D3C81_1392430 [compost metagenome]